MSWSGTEIKNNLRSPNCKDDETPTSMFTYFAHHDNEEEHEEVQSFMLSCQKQVSGGPDDKTLDHMKSVYAKQIEETDLSKVHIHSHAMKLESTNISDQANKIRERRMASNCHDGARPSDVTNFNKYTCRYLGVGLDENGKKVQNPFQKWSGTLASCEKSIDISSQTANDIRVLAYDQAKGKEAQLNINEFICDISAIPNV